MRWLGLARHNALMTRRTLVTGALLLLTPLSLLYALTAGSVPLSVGELLRALAADTGTPTTVVLELRLPRALAGFAVGGMLALAGALLQVLLRNPLADPYVLGISGGASVATLLALLLGASGLYAGVAGFVGASASMFLVFGLSRIGGPWTQTRLLLTGVVLATGWGACVSLLLALTPSTQLHGVVFWLLGDLSAATHPGVGIVLLVIGLGVALIYARPLNVLARGETVAATLGEQPQRLRLVVYFLASLLTAVAVSMAGSIGFIGLIVPHALRLLGGADHRYVLPNAVLLGGSLLVLADTFARSAFAPIQLPAGVFTALIGVPAFLLILTRATRTPPH